MGIFPAAGGTQRAPRIIGVARSLELMFTGRLVQAQEALQIGLIHRLSDDPLDAASRLADRLTRMPNASLRAIKQLVHCACDRPFSEGLKQERTAFVQLLRDPECLAALKSFAGGVDPVAR